MNDHTLHELVHDTAHWQQLKPPLAPSTDEVDMYRRFVVGFSPVYLLGMTRALLPLCDVAVDLNPVATNKPVLKRDWRDLRDLGAGVIIGDGVLNLAGMELVDSLLARCERLVCRVFLKKLPGMKYATHFPHAFPSASCVIPTQEYSVMVVWDRK